MSITVKDCLKLPSLIQGKVIAGEKGLNRIVNMVSVLEIFDDFLYDFDNSVDNGYICITSLFCIREKDKMQPKIIEYLNARGDACIVLYYVGVCLPKVTTEMIDAANKLNFPIILMPEKRMDFRYNEAISEISDLLRRDENNSKNFIDKIATIVSNLPENKKTLKNLMRIISDNLKCTLLICDSNMAHTSVTPWPLSNDISADDIINTYKSNSSNGDMVMSVTINSIPVHLYRLNFSSIEYSDYYLYGVDASGFVNLTDLYQVTELLLIFSRLWNINSHDILTGSLISTIMDGDDNNMRLISKKLSFDISKINTMLIIDTNASPDSNFSIQYKIKNEIIQHVKDLSADYNKRIVIDTYGIYIIAFIKLYPNNEIDMTYIKHLQTVVSKVTDKYTVSFFSNDDNIFNVRQTYQFYIETINNAQIIFPHKRIFSYGDLLFADKCMSAIEHNTHELRICKNIIEPLNDIHDKDNLLETLSTYYLDCDCKINKTSEILFLHRNTIQYRLNKIKEITNYNPQSTLDSSVLQLATGCHRLSNFINNRN